jgi:hypothetical protein
MRLETKKLVSCCGCGCGVVIGGTIRERSLGHLDPGAIEILLQAGIELGQTAVLEVGDTLLLVLDITTGAKFVSRHGREIEFGAREKGGLFRREGEERQAGSKG